jgi:hypothetical protein
VAKLQQRYDNDLSAFQAKQLLRPTKRIEANLKRIKTLEKKKAATVQRVIAAVEKNVGSVKDKTRLTEAVAAALEPPKVETKAKKRRVEVEEESD